MDAGEITVAPFSLPHVQTRSLGQFINRRIDGRARAAFLLHYINEKGKKSKQLFQYWNSFLISLEVFHTNDLT